MTNLYKQMGISCTDASRMVSRICNGMTIEVINLLQEHKISKVDFTKISESSIIRPRVKHMDYGKVIGIALTEDDNLDITFDKGETCTYKANGCYLSYYDMYSILACVEECTAQRNRKSFTEKGIIIRNK